MSFQDPFLRVPHELLWEVANQVELEDLPILCQVNHLFRGLCQDWGYFRHRAETQLGITPWEFDHDGVSKNPIKRFYQFWLRTENCIWGMGYLDEAVCLSRAIDSNRPDLIRPKLFQRNRTTNHNAISIVSIMDGFLPAKQLIEYQGLDKYQFKPFGSLAPPEEWTRWFLHDFPLTSQAILTQALNCQVPSFGEETTSLSRFLLLILPRFIGSLEEIRPLLSDLTWMDPTTIIMYLNYGIGYYGRRDLAEELKRTEFYNPSLIIYGNLARFEDPEWFRQLNPRVGLSTLELVLQVIFLQSFRKGPGEYFRIAALEYLRRNGKSSFPFPVLDLIIPLQGINYLRILKEVGYDLPAVLSGHLDIITPEMLARLSEEELL